MVIMSKPIPIFIVGSPRSGTTFLRDLLNSHPHLAIPNETHFIPKLYLAYGEPQSLTEVKKIFQWIEKTSYFRRFQIELKSDDLNNCQTFSDIIYLIFNAYAQKQGKKRWADKTPTYLNHMQLLLKIFPNAKFIHLIRDGRDVALSMIPLVFSHNNIYTAAWGWKNTVNKGIKQSRSIPQGQYLEIRFEDLILETEKTMKNLCQFIDEPYTSDILKATRSGDYQHMSGTILPVADLSKINQWENKMSIKDQMIFESVAGDLLAQLGYRIIHQPKPISLLMKSAYWIHDSFIKFLHFFKPNRRGIKTSLLEWSLKFKRISLH